MGHQGDLTMTLVHLPHVELRTSSWWKIAVEHAKGGDHGQDEAQARVVVIWRTKSFTKMLNVFHKQ